MDANHDADEDYDPFIYRPTPEEIAEACELIQLTWSPQEREKRDQYGKGSLELPGFGGRRNSIEE